MIDASFQDAEGHEDPGEPDAITFPDAEVEADARVIDPGLTDGGIATLIGRACEVGDCSPGQECRASRTALNPFGALVYSSPLRSLPLTSSITP